MIKVVLIEDEETYFHQFSDLVERYRKEGNEIEFHWFSDGYDFLDQYHSGDCDVVFMDIEMPAIDGISLAKLLRKKDPYVPLVFVTVMAQLAIKGYEVDAMDFIVKPITYFNFVLKLEKATKKSIINNTIALKLKDDSGNMVYVYSKEIFYIESFGHKCVFHTEKGELHTYGSMTEYENKYDCCNFIRCDNSFLVNPRHITKAGKDSIEIKDRTIPISRARRKAFMDKMAKFHEHLH